MNILWIDYVILGIILISMIISLFRGFVREALSLVGWGVAIFVAFRFMHPMAIFIKPYFTSLPDSILSVMAFSSLLILTLIVSALIINLIAKLVEHSGLSGTDRVIGLLFGLARGVLLIGIMVLLAGFTAVPQDEWWKQSIFLSHFQQLAMILASFLPSDMASKVHF